MENKIEKGIRGLMVLALLLTGLCASGQGAVAKKLAPEEYGKWHSLAAGGLSEDGRWAAYRLVHEDGTDTLFVAGVGTGARHVLPGASGGRFIGRGAYAALAGGALWLLDLDTGRRTEVPGVSDFVALRGSGLLFAECRAAGSRSIAVLDARGKKIWGASGITGYALSDAGDAVAYGQAEGDGHVARLARIGKNMAETELMASAPHALQVFSWDAAGKNVAFAGTGRDAAGGRIALAVYAYGLGGRKLRVLGAASPLLPQGRVLSPPLEGGLRMAADGKQVFLSLSTGGDTAPERQAPREGLQVWNTLDRLHFASARISPEGRRMMLAVWTPAAGRLLPIAASPAENAIVGGGRQRHALVYDFLKYQPYLSDAPDIDLYLADLKTGARRLLLERFSGHGSRLSLSPDGRYVAYFRDGDWWVCGIETGRHARASRKEEGSLGEEGYDLPGEPRPAAEPAWTAGDAVMLYQDGHDVWKYDPVRDVRVRLTRGRESGMVFQLYGMQDGGSGRFQKAPLAVLEGAVLFGRRKDHSETGFFRLQGGRLDTLVFGPRLYGRLLLSRDGGTAAYVSERYDRPRAMEARELSSGRELLVVASNPQQAGYDWGRTEVVRYRDAGGRELRGVLCYPQGYDARRKYPMVVHVYQKQSHRLHGNINPTLHNETGFNPTLLSAAGYFVLLPDVLLETGRVGRSALECVVAAVEAALGTASIDRSRLGLMGASFGGFETNFIVSQTSMFAAAVGGSSMNDFISGYFSVNRNDTLFEAWRYEADQPRMGASPFADWEAYLDNSPLRHAERIQTPLLLWAGMEDRQVHPLQTMEMHLALRRLGKESTMLLYEGEDHAMRELHNQRDLTAKIMEWFAWHLKGEERPEWAVPKR